MIDMPPVEPNQNPVEILHHYVERAVQQSRDSGGMGSDIQSRVVRQEAQRFGTEIGFYYSYNQIQHYLRANEVALDGIFNFSRLTIDGKVTLPVIIETERIYEQQSDTSSRRVRTSYQIHEGPRMVAAPPTWRDYLVRAPIAPEMPNPAVIPTNDRDLLMLWRQEVANSFQEGVRSANRTFELDLARLRRDYIGRMTFDVLARKKMVERPIISVNELGIVSDDRFLSIGDRIETVVYQQGFNDPDTWIVRGVEPQSESVIERTENEDSRINRRR